MKMKSAVMNFLFLSICFLPLAISVRPPFIRLPTETDYPPVLDTDGNPVVYGTKYYAKTTCLDVQGGISTVNHMLCSNAVALNLSIFGNPQPSIRPITFVNPSGGTQIVQENLPLNVGFSEPYDLSESCPEPLIPANRTVWKLNEYTLVVTGGVIGEPDTWFIIQHSNSSPGNYIFYRIGTVDNLLRLGINDDSPYPFKFVRVQD